MPLPATFGKEVELVNSNSMKHAASLAEWKDRIMDCRTSGLTVQVWCEKNGLNRSTYYRWEREIFGRMDQDANQASETEAKDTALFHLYGGFAAMCRMAGRKQLQRCVYGVHGKVLDSRLQQLETVSLRTAGGSAASLASSQSAM